MNRRYDVTLLLLVPLLLPRLLPLPLGLLLLLHGTMLSKRVCLVHLLIGGEAITPWSAESVNTSEASKSPPQLASEQQWKV